MRKKRLIDKMMDDMEFNPNGDWINGKPPSRRRIDSQEQKRTSQLILWIGLPLMLVIMAIGNYFG